jgi:hypothetical protein
MFLRRDFAPGFVFKGASSSKDVYISKYLGDEITFRERICPVNFKFDCKSKALLQEILELGLSGVFRNVTIALRLYVSLPASVASGERTFSLLKHV